MATTDRYKWRVGLLLELKPSDMSRGGDNMNRGQQVRIKVRQPTGDFYDFDHVLLVMLHELCHNRHGKHDHDFYTVARHARTDTMTRTRAGPATAPRTSPKRRRYVTKRALLVLPQAGAGGSG